jgi:cytosine/adenosine deaminase-related metal-dependent hydrolase
MQRGVPVALGIDEAGINDDKDILQEMRLALRVHRTPGMDDAVPTPAEVFQMATENGALTTPFGAHIGTLEPGKAADVVVMNWKHIAYPSRCGGTGRRCRDSARARGVETVLVAGKWCCARRFTRVDKHAAREDWRDNCARRWHPARIELAARVSLVQAVLRRRGLSQAVRARSVYRMNSKS